MAYMKDKLERNQSPKRIARKEKRQDAPIKRNGIISGAGRSFAIGLPKVGNTPNIVVLRGNVGKSKIVWTWARVRKIVEQKQLVDDL
jgi:hypothetical protein